MRVGLRLHGGAVIGDARRLYGYDARGQQLYARFDGPTGADTVDNAYDGFGRLESQTTAMYGVSRTVGYRYDADGNRIRITHPDGVYFTTDYDGLDRASAVRENGATTIASMTYDNAGRAGSETRDTVTTTFGYDGVGRLSSLDDDLPGGTANDITTTFSYSPASQLVGRIRSNPAPYAWPGYINVSRSYTANGLNQYATVAGTSLGYDANGNLVSDGTTTYTYDTENRLVMTSYGGGTTLLYDPLGRLYGFAGTAGKSSVYDGDQRIVDYTADPAGIAMRYVMDPGTDNPLIWYYGSGLSDRRSLQADERGSIVSVVDSAGALIGTNSYDEYGIPAASNIGRYGYTGRVWISTLGMWYYKARMYSPTLGRFPQTDPIGYADQNNLYAYVGNDPMNQIDPTGLFGLFGGCPPGSRCTSSDPDVSNAADHYGGFANATKQAAIAKSIPGSRWAGMDAAEIASQMAEIKAMGKQGEAEAVRRIEEKGWKIIGTLVYVKTRVGLRVIDILVQTRLGPIVALEVKYSSIGIWYYPKIQRYKDFLLKTEGGILISPNVLGMLPGEKVNFRTFPIYIRDIPK